MNANFSQQPVETFIKSIRCRSRCCTNVSYDVATIKMNHEDFKECLGKVEEAINESCFLAIDGEFTGLENDASGTSGPFDTPCERYCKLRKASADFLLVQFGLCAFKYNDSTKRYIAKPFNFYIFPRPYNRQAPDRRFLCQTSCLDFLASQNFDFNKWIQEGISYLTPQQEQQLKDTVDLKQQQYAHSQLPFSSPAFTTPDSTEYGVSKGPVPIPDDQKEFIEDICGKVANFVDNSEDETLDLPVCCGYQRKLVYQVLRSKHSSGIHLQTKSGDKRERYIQVTRVKNEEELEKKEMEKQSVEYQEIEDAVGFSKVIKMISQSGKLLIGHNMLLDLIHTLSQFYFSLPEDYEEFKSMTRCVFPRILDTKLMASTQPFKDKILSTGLGQLFETLEHKPFTKPEIDVPEDFSMYKECNKEHEAAYDAFITGICFIGMANYLGSFSTPPKERIPPSSNLIEPFVNKLFLMRVQDIPYLNLSGPDLNPNRDHIFHITFPKEWRASDLHQLFIDHGCIQIFWIDDVSAHIVMHQRDSAKQALKSLKCTDNTYTLMSFEEHKRKEQHSEKYSPLLRKRSSPTSDGEPPLKKKKTLNVKEEESKSKSTSTVAPAFISRRSISPIPEEMEEDKVQETQNGTDTGVTNTSGSKMFDVPETW